jgi:hypothetical protein
MSTTIATVAKGVHAKNRIAFSRHTQFGHSRSDKGVVKSILARHSRFRVRCKSNEEAAVYPRFDRGDHHVRCMGSEPEIPPDWLPVSRFGHARHELSAPLPTSITIATS